MFIILLHFIYYNIFMKHQSSLSGDRAKCTVCPRNCNMKEGHSGFCHVRKNIGGKVVSRTYGYNTGLVVDPIEKKPLYHFYPSSKILSFGTLGCNMGCQFCQNWHLSRSCAEPDSINADTPVEIAQKAIQSGCKSVGFTYNEPTIFLEYAIDTAIECHKIGVKTVAVSAGYINPEAREEFFGQMDGANIDLKGFSEEFYKKNCFAELGPVLETIKYISSQTSCWLELTTLLIEGENDSEDMLKRQCAWIANEVGINTPLHFSAFYPAYKFSNRAPTRPETVLRAREIAFEAGLRYVYCGNVADIESSTTYCHHCKSAIIKRVGRGVGEYNLESGGHCKFCGTLCAGVYD